MKAHYRTRDGRMQFEVAAELQKELFRQIAQIQDTFEPDACGCCNGTNVRLSARSIDANDYYAWLCTDCGASLQLGQHRQGGTLFPKRGEGWKKFKPGAAIEAPAGQGARQ